MKKFLMMVALLGIATFAAERTWAINLVTNPGFESGTTGWTFVSDASNTGLNATAHTGTESAFKNLFGTGAGTVSQTITTIPGDNYLVDFWIADNSFQAGTLTASFAGTTGFSQTNLSLPAGIFSEYSFTALASGTSSTFQWAGTVTGGTYFLDDVSVTDLGPNVKPAPEPSTLFLVGTGVLGLLGYGRRKSAQ